MSAIERPVPMCDALAACTILSASSRMLRAKRRDVSSCFIFPVPVNGPADSFGERHRGLPPGRAREASDVGLEMHDLVRTIGYLAVSDRGHGIDRAADQLDHVAQHRRRARA